MGAQDPPQRKEPGPARISSAPPGAGASRAGPAEGSRRHGAAGRPAAEIRRLPIRGGRGGGGRGGAGLLSREDRGSREDETEQGAVS